MDSDEGEMLLSVMNSVSVIWLEMPVSRELAPD
jgi:hypothetical protein